MCFGVTPAVSQMPSARLQQMAADSNGPSLFEVDLSARQYRAQVHLARRIAEDSPPMELHPGGNTMYFSVLPNTIIRLNCCRLELKFSALILAFV